MAERAATAWPAGLALTLATALVLAGCASGPRGGRDGPGDKTPADVANVPDAQPQVEAIRRSGGTSKPYTVLGRGYTPITDDRPFSESGLASWYGRKFHAQSTASGEPYDMYAMTAAHKTLPLPSYVWVRNPANGRQVVVRVNDRGPFVDGRVIDLSYAAAARLDLLRGVAPVEIERITNEDVRTGAWRRDGGTAYAAAGSAAAAAAALAPASTAPVAASATTAGLAAFAGPDAARAAQPTQQAQVQVPSQWVQPVADATVVDASPSASAPAPARPPEPVDPPAPVRYIEARNLGYLGMPEAATTPDAAAPPPPAGSVMASAPNAGASPAAARAFWVQLGAFREAAGAQDLLARAARGAPELADQLRVFGEAGTNRLQAGPFATRAQAGDALARLREGTGIAPIIVERN